MKPGDVFDDRYELGEIIGSGGTGTVWRARDTVLARDVAVKVLRVGELGDEVQRARLRGEAQLAGGLNHPAIGQVFDYGVVDEAPYIVMGLVPGVPLSKVLREERRLAPGRTMRIVSQLAGGLEMAHQAGIVHRDLKPANVMIDEDDRAVLLDFGIARAATDEPLTATGTIVGTVDYISPEQAAGGSATAHSDLYGLGMVAYECLSGQRPFRRESQVATALAHLHEEAPPLPDDVPLGVRNLVAALIAKDPAARPESAGMVAVAAEALAADLSATQGPGGVAVDAAVTALLTRTPDTTETRLAPSRRWWWALAPVVVAMLVLGGWRATGSETVRVPDVVGMTSADASRVLDATGLEPRRIGVDAAGVRGTVLTQRPSQGEKSQEGDVVTLEVASGQVILDADVLVGASYDDAAAALHDLGLDPLRVEREGPGAPGTVIAVGPSGELQTGTTVTVTVVTD